MASQCWHTGHVASAWRFRKLWTGSVGPNVLAHAHCRPVRRVRAHSTPAESAKPLSPFQTKSVQSINTVSRESLAASSTADAECTTHKWEWRGHTINYAVGGKFITPLSIHAMTRPAPASASKRAAVDIVLSVADCWLWHAGAACARVWRQ